MGRARNVSLEVVGIIDFLEESEVPHRVTSTFRPGGSSRHGRKLAVDFAATEPGRDTEELAAIFNVFAPIASHLYELIYSGPQVRRNVKRGRFVNKYAQAEHHDHVHVAVDPGVNLVTLVPEPAPVTDDTVADREDREDPREPVDAIPSPQGGAWVLTRDGGVRTYDAADATPFRGSYPGLPPEHRQGERTFVEMQPNDRGGYDLISSGGERYSFPFGRRR